MQEKESPKYKFQIMPPCGKAPQFCLNILCNRLNLPAMTDEKDKQRRASQKALRLKSAQKQAQLSEALRANLKRRKEQARERKKPDNA